MMLNRYLDSAYLKASLAEQSCFARLLDFQDTELLDFFIGSKLPESKELTELVKKIRSLTPSGG